MAAPSTTPTWAPSLLKILPLMTDPPGEAPGASCACWTRIARQFGRHAGTLWAYCEQLAPRSRCRADPGHCAAQGNLPSGNERDGVWITALVGRGDAAY